MSAIYPPNSQQHHNFHRMVVVPSLLNLRGGRLKMRRNQLSCSIFSFLIALILHHCHHGSLPSQFVAEAVPASPHPFRHEQPDGSYTTSIYVRGDHTFYFFTDENDFTVIDNDDGWKVYATRNETSGHLQPTNLIVGVHDPKLGIADGRIRRRLELPSLDIRNSAPEICGKFCANRPRRKFGEKDEEKRRLRGRKNQVNTNKKSFNGGGFDFPEGVTQNFVSPVSNGNIGPVLLNTLVVLIRFADHDNRDLPSVNKIDRLMNMAGGDPTLASYGSIRDYFAESSYGHLTVKSMIRPWFRLPRSEVYYADKSSGATEKFEAALKLALENLDNDPSFSFDEFDRNGDGSVDSIMFLHSGYGAEWGKPDCEGRAVEDRIWAHKWEIGNDWTSKSGIKVNRYHASSALWSTCGNEVARIGTIVHELGHILGLPDLYSTGSGIGSFGVMGNSWGFDGSQRFPPIMCAWTKFQMGWLQPKEIDSSGVYELEASAIASSAYIIKEGFPPGEYLLLENRQAIGFDSYLPQGGIAIWHIDSFVPFGNSPGFPGQNGWPGNNNHYHVALLQQDGRYDLERGENRGDSSDLWHRFSSGTVIGPSTSQSRAFPNTNSYRVGVDKPTGISISDFSLSRQKMTFQVMIPGSGNPAPTVPSLEGSTNTQPKAIKEIITTLQGANGSFGIMFEVRNISAHPLIIHALSFHTRSRKPDLHVEVLTKTGSHMDRGQQQWMPVADVFIAGKGFLQLTHIPDEGFEDIKILQGEKQSFFIMLETADMRYTNGEAGDFLQPFTKNSDIEVLVGSGVGKKRFDSIFLNRVFNGSIKYSSVMSNNNDNNGDGTPITHSIRTTYAQNNGSYGSIFDVTAISSVQISSIDIHTRKQGSIPVEIWTKLGSGVSFESNEDAWTLLIRIYIQGKGLGQPTNIPLDSVQPLTIARGEIRAFYVTLQTNDLRYTNGDLPVGNKHLKISQGTGVGGYRFDSSIFKPRTWNGDIHYNVIEVDKSSVQSSSTSTSLLTTLEGGNGAYGCQFDIVANRDIVIRSLDIHVRTKTSFWVEVYSRKGTHEGHETKPEDWTKIFYFKVDGQGATKPTSLPAEFFAPVRIQGGSVQSFYVTLRNPDLRYTNGLSVGSPYASNAYFTVLEGTGIGSYKFKRTVPNRIFNGLIHFEPITISTYITYQLRSPMSGETGAYGNIFDVTAKKDINITSMSFHTESLGTVNVEVWTRKGSYSGYETSLTGWERIATASVKGNGRGIATSIPKDSFTSLQLSPYETQAFFVTLRSAEMRYSKQSVNDEVIAENEDLRLLPGLGIASYPLGADTYFPRGWNGFIHYTKL